MTSRSTIFGWPTMTLRTSARRAETARELSRILSVRAAVSVGAMLIVPRGASKGRADGRFTGGALPFRRVSDDTRPRESNADAATIRRGSAILARPMRRPLLPLAAAALLLLALLLPDPAEAKTNEEEEARSPARTPTARPYYGPPAPTPEPYLRAAGACMEFTPGQYLVLAEVGATGRVFRIDADTRDRGRRSKKGVRVRVLYVDGPERAGRPEDPAGPGCGDPAAAHAVAVTP